MPRVQFFLLASYLALVLGCSKPPPPEPLPKAHSPALAQFIPGDADVVARISLTKARDAGMVDVIRGILVDIGLSPAILEAVSGCLATSDALHLALRLGPNGADGDLIAVVTGIPTEPGVPCGAKGWAKEGQRQEFEVFLPKVPSAERSAGALMLRSTRGEVLVATPGQIDAILRLLRDGPDADRTVLKGDSAVVVASSAHESLLPESWKLLAPNVAEIAIGLTQLVVSLDFDENQGVGVRAELEYRDDRKAEEAGKLLHRVRDAMVAAGNPTIKRVGESAHATIRGSVIEVVFAVGPRGPSELAPATPSR